jgi:hypothetical protein
MDQFSFRMGKWKLQASACIHRHVCEVYWVCPGIPQFLENSKHLVFYVARFKFEFLKQRSFVNFKNVEF